MKLTHAGPRGRDVRRHYVSPVISIAVAGSLLLAACGDGDEKTAASAAPGSNPPAGTSSATSANPPTATSSATSANPPADTSSATSSKPPTATSSPPAAASGATVTGDDLVQYIGKPDKALCNGRTYTFGYNTFSDTEEFAVNLYEGIKRVAAELGCVKIDKLVDNVDAGQAVSNARIFAQRKVDGALLFNVLDAAGPGQVQVLKPAGIPSVTIVVKAPGETFVTNDDFSDGRSTGTALGDAYKAKTGAGPAYALVGRFDGQGATGKARMDGVVDGLKSSVPNVKIFEFDTSAEPSKAQAAAAAVLAKVPDGATVLATAINDQNVNAVYQAIKQAGREDDALVSGLGAVNPGGLQFICQNKGYIGGQGFFPETWPNYMIPALIARINGAKTVPEKIVVPTKFIKRDDIATVYPDFKCGS